MSETKPKSAAQRNRMRMSASKEGSGMIWRNKDKDATNPEQDKWSDFEGQCCVAGIHYFVNGWINVSEKGFKYLGLKFKRMNARNLKEHAEADRAEHCAP